MRDTAHLAGKMLDDVGRLDQQFLQLGHDGEDVASRAMHCTRSVVGNCQARSQANASILTVVSEDFGSCGEVFGVGFEPVQASHSSK
jgi:hypothetical protein